MIFFGHVGPTMALIKGYDKIRSKKEDYIDYRVVMVGSVLPDIIDKPIGAVFFRNVFHNSRIFGHTLLFSLILILIGIFRMIKYKKTGNNFFILGICSFVHQMLDSMWLYKAIFLWPLYGLQFPRRAEGDWLDQGITRLFTDPTYFTAEIIGFIIVMYFLVQLIRTGKLKLFIKKGIL
ncbi:MAG: metal-dependent hydrolase [Clostridium sp.]|nr:metal-dependent hydrolase [Clostridium sp.]